MHLEGDIRIFKMVYFVYLCILSIFYLTSHHLSHIASWVDASNVFWLCKTSGIAKQKSCNRIKELLIVILQ